MDQCRVVCDGEALHRDVAHRMKTLTGKDSSSCGFVPRMATRDVSNPSSVLQSLSGSDSSIQAGTTHQKSNIVSDVNEGDFITELFGVSLATPKDIDTFTSDLESGKYRNKLVAEKTDASVSGLQSIPHKDINVSEFFGVPFETLVDIDNLTRDIETGNTKSTSYVGVAGASTKAQPQVNSNFRPLVADPIFNGVNISIPRKVVEKVSARLDHTLYGYFIGKRLAFPIVGLEAVLESGPWMIRNTPIILKKWSMSTSLLKEELTCIPIWVKLHDIPLQVFEEDVISLIATFIGKPIMLDSYTSSMYVVTIGIPSLTRDDFTKETIRVEYEWRPPMCDECKIFGHVHDHCPKKVASKKKMRKGKSKSTNGGEFAGPSVKQTVRYEPKAIPSAPKKGATNVSNPSKSSSVLKTAETSPKKVNFTTSNSFSALNDEEEDDEEVENVYDESANLFKTGGSSSFTAAGG
ncbi:zinc knuckle CX2CX4HX4C containing protein [Tanacetum coccineum]|uniref:Zinc knuckle CX2CX4HX4C containing protein n=1 Tax=Tanacetum coccineum TaxID=301880 RepID=A0ABQ5GBU2_9ASTR